MKHTLADRHLRAGFTIVELIVIIVVIAILAAISIVGYNSVRNSAIRETLRSDVQEAAAQLEKERQKIGTYPASASTVNGGKGLIASDGNTIQYIKVSDKAYCVMVSSSGDTGIEPVHQVNGNTKVQNGACPITVANAGVTETFAGSTTPGYAVGSGTAARFSPDIRGIAVDDAGYIYVADFEGNRIRKISPEGYADVLAGSGVAATVDGTGVAAQFNRPCGIALDGRGNVYVSEYSGHRIRKISPKGVVTTLAGGSSAGYVNGVSTVARFSSPCGLAAESSGVLYVADSGNRRIRKVATNGEVSSVAGSGTAGLVNGAALSARFDNPLGVARDNSGALYIADTGNNVIRKLTTLNTVETVATGNTFSGVRSVAVDALGTLYVAERSNHRIRQVSSAGVVTLLAGSGVAGSSNGTGAAAQFSSPNALTVDRNGVVYVASESMIRVIK